MATYRIRPTKPAAVISAVVGAGMIVFAAVQMRTRAHSGFLILWIVAVVAIAGFNLWSAFSGRGGTPVFGSRITRDDDADPPNRT